MLELLQKGRILPSSDKKYLENVISLYLGGTRTESLQYSGHNVEELYDEIQTLNQKILKLEQKGIERYFGKKAILFFATFFIGWNALQTYTVSALNPFITSDMIGYLFPLNALANYFNAAPLVWFVFILMILAWPFIGTIHLANFIKTRKISNKS